MKISWLSKKLYNFRIQGKRITFFLHQGIERYFNNIERKANHKKKVINFELDKDKTFF